MVLVFTVWFNICSVLFAHPMYCSITNMDIDAQRRSIVLSIRLFTDDLETILHNKYNVDGWIGTPNEHRDSRQLLMEYLNERFSITVNNVEKMALVTDSIVFDKDEESVMWFYLKGVAQQPIRKIEVDNRLLNDFFSSQNNMLIISVNRKEIKWDKLNRKKYKIELSL